MAERSAIDLAYLAGVVDSDGFVSIAKSHYRDGRLRISARVGICGTRTAPLELAVQVFGGRCRCYLNRSSPRPMWEWTRSGAAAVPVLDALLAYLRVKRPQAELALEAQMVASQALALGVSLDAQLCGLHAEILAANQWRRAHAG